MRSTALIPIKQIADATLRAALTQLVNWLTEQPQIQLYEFDSLYTVPMYLALEQEPTGGILCLRVRELPDQEKVVPHTGRVSFTWERGRARIDAIGGMTVGTGKTYRFNFAAIGTN